MGEPSTSEIPEPRSYPLCYNTTMTDHPVFSFVFDRGAAWRQFLQIAPRDVVLAVLARLPPEPAWDGCLVYEGPSPDGHAGEVCVGIVGPAADGLQESLVAAFEELGIPVPQIWEGGPEVRDRIATVRNGVWASPGPVVTGISPSRGRRAASRWSDGACRSPAAWS